VTGLGSVEIKRQPEVLRVQVEVLAKGKDVADALAKLKERRAAAEKKLADLGAAKEAVAFGEPALTAEKTDRQRQMEMMVRDRLSRKGGKNDPKAKQPPAVVVSATLKAELPLKAGTPEEFLALAHGLTEKIKAADLGGQKELKQLSPQEEEAAEETAAEVGMSGEEPQRGEPLILYVSKISEEEHDKALAEAFQKARREAGRLARSAGAELGPLHHLANTSQSGGDIDPEMYAYSRANYYRMMQGNRSGEDRATEAVGVQPGKTTFRVMVTASFLVKKPADK
jgi:uncharacterized protein YggE